MSDQTETMTAIACGDAPVLETLTAMNLDSLERSGLDPKTYTMVRIAALVAMDAAPVSYAVTAEAATDVLEVGDLEAILVALAPVVGSARIAAAAANLLDVYFDEPDEDLEEYEDADDEIAVAVAETDARELTVVETVGEAEEYAAESAEDAEFEEAHRELEAI